MGGVSQLGNLLVRGMTAVLIVLLSLAIPAYADGLDQIRDFNIDEQALDTALIEFSEQAGVQLMVPTELIADLRSPSIAGQYAADKALIVLLEGSELTFQAIGDDTVTLQAADQGGDSDLKNLSPVPILMAQNTSRSQTSTEINSRSSEGGTSVITGRVTDARTGANLKGAKVTVAETEQWTSTNDLGRFRLVNVPTGRVTLTVSYLGYAGQSAVISVHGDAVSQNFTLRGGSELEEIVVFGQRSARALALNQERTAANALTVISADLLGNFNSTTISEALRRAPGVAFIPDPNTGDGANVIIRGLEPDLNQITLNGLRLPDGSGVGRSPDLSGILTESIESVTINKSLLPSQDSNGAGGLIEIETKSPLDRDRRFASLGFEYGERGGDFGDEVLVNGTLSGIFGGNQEFGISLSASYREREQTNLAYNVQILNDGGFETLPLNMNGDPVSSIFEIDPRLTFPFESGVDRIYPNSVFAAFGSTEDKIANVTTSIEKQFGAHTNLRFDATYTEIETDLYDTSTLTFAQSQYASAPVSALGGEMRFGHVVENPFAGDPLEAFFGDGIIGSVRRDATLRPDINEENLTLSLRGETVFDNWELGYTIGTSESSTKEGEHFSTQLGVQSSGTTGLLSLAAISPILLMDEARENTTGDGRIISIFAPLETSSGLDFILPLFNNDGFTFFNSVGSVPLGSILSFGPRETKGDSFQFKFNIKRSFDGDVVKYVDVGLDYQGLTSRATAAPFEGDLEGGLYVPAMSDLSAGDFGFQFGPGLLTSVGAVNDFSSLSRESVESATSGLDQLVSNGSLVLAFERPLLQFEDTTTDEEMLTGYVEAEVNFDKLQIIGGARVERIEIGSTFFSSASVIELDGSLNLFQEDADFATESVSQTEILPRVLANYRFNDDLVLRGDYFLTVSRPQLFSLSQEAFFSFDKRFSRLIVRRGNPDLKPAETHNLGLGAEWYTSDVGVLKASLFYKVIENPLQTNSVQGGIDKLPDELTLPELDDFQNLPDNVEVVVTQPVNGGTSDKIWGLELTGERQLTFLPGIYSGLGVYANYTYTDSEGTRRISTSVVPEGFVEISAPFSEDPEHQGTVGLTYSKYGVDASLFYTVQERRLANVNRFGLDDYNEKIDTLDFRAEYLTNVLGADLRFFVRGEDLLRDKAEPYLQTSIGGENGVPKYFTGARYFGGRSIFFGVNSSF